MGGGGLECVHDSIKLANSSSDPCRMWLHYIGHPTEPPPPEIAVGPQQLELSLTHLSLMGLWR